MKANLSFIYGASAIMDLIDAETSRHAAFLRYQDGGSAYDSLKIHTNDKPKIEDFVADAFRAVSARFDGDCKYSLADGGHALGFYLPDFDEDRRAEANDEIQRHVVLSATARWLMDRSFGEYAKMVATDAEGSLNRAVSVLRTRKSPLD